MIRLYVGMIVLCVYMLELFLILSKLIEFLIESLRNGIGLIPFVRIVILFNH